MLKQLKKPTTGQKNKQDKGRETISNAEKNITKITLEVKKINQQENMKHNRQQGDRNKK